MKKEGRWLLTGLRYLVFCCFVCWVKVKNEGRKNVLQELISNAFDTIRFPCYCSFFCGECKVRLWFLSVEKQTHCLPAKKTTYRWRQGALESFPSPFVAKRSRDIWGVEPILLMEQILHQVISSLSNYFQGFILPMWCRISSINSVSFRPICSTFSITSTMWIPMIRMIGQYVGLAGLRYNMEMMRRYYPSLVCWKNWKGHGMSCVAGSWNFSDQVTL